MLLTQAFITIVLVTSLIGFCLCLQYVVPLYYPIYVH